MPRRGQNLWPVDAGNGRRGGALRRALRRLRDLSEVAAPHLDRDDAALGQRVPKTVTRVGLFVDPDDALLDEKIATGALDLLQLHGSETPERVAAIRRAPACR